MVPPIMVFGDEFGLTARGSSGGQGSLLLGPLIIENSVRLRQTFQFRKRVVIQILFCRRDNSYCRDSGGETSFSVMSGVVWGQQRLWRHRSVFFVVQLSRSGLL